MSLLRLLQEKLQRLAGDAPLRKLSQAMEIGKACSPAAVSAIEFFAGTGGLHLALKSAMPEAAVLQAFDIHAPAVAVYAHNFPAVSIVAKSIESLSPRDLHLPADIWLMSPPCQPFVAGGRGTDERDTRNAALFHIMDMLNDLEPQDRPLFLFLENVVGFASSTTRRMVERRLQDAGFSQIRGVIATPLQVGIPNDRKRFYLMARRCSGRLEAHELLSNAPARPEAALPPPPRLLDRPLFQETSMLEMDPLQHKAAEHLLDDDRVQMLQEFLDDCHGAATSAVDMEIDPAEMAPLVSRQFKFDIVHPFSRTSSAFTKSYRSKYGYFKGIGSILCIRSADAEEPPASERYTANVADKTLRWFSTSEIQRIHCYPETYRWPADNPSITEKTKYALLGNGVNIRVCARLLGFLLSTDAADSAVPADP